MTPRELCSEATKLGLRLEPRGDKLAVIPANRCPADFAAVLRQHKSELLELLESTAFNLTPDCRPWLHVARQVLEGEFDGGMTASMRQSLIIGLRSIPHPRCVEALARLARA